MRKLVALLAILLAATVLFASGSAEAEDGARHAMYPYGWMI